MTQRKRQTTKTEDTKLQRFNLKANFGCFSKMSNCTENQKHSSSHNLYNINSLGGS